MTVLISLLYMALSLHFLVFMFLCFVASFLIRLANDGFILFFTEEGLLD